MTELAERACSALFDWSQESLLIREDLVELKAHKVLITCMENNVHNGHIISNAAGTLFELAKNSKCLMSDNHACALVYVCILSDVSHLQAHSLGVYIHMFGGSDDQ